MASPSIFSSVSQLTGAPASRAVRSSQPASSSAEKTLSRLSIRSACSTAANPVANPPPTRWLGESGVSSDGYCASSASSSRSRVSNSPSAMVGASST